MASGPPVVQMCKTPEAFLDFVKQAKESNRDIIVSPLLFAALPKWQEVVELFKPTTKVAVAEKGIIGKCDDVTIYTDSYVPVNKRTMPWIGDFPMLALI